MKTIFDFDDYRNYLRSRLELMPKAGYGQLSKLADFMNVHSSLVSQIFAGQKQLTVDLAALVAEYFGLSANETDYFLCLVQLDRAGNEVLRKNLRRNLKDLKKRAADLKQIISVEKILSEEQRAVFYSSWTYSATRQLAAIGDGMDLQSLAECLDLPLNAMKRILDFLTSTGLCAEKKNRFKIGPASTYIDPGSPWTRVHHRNWRDKAVEAMEQEREDNLYYTSPLTISVSDAEKVRRFLIEAIQHINSIVDPSSSEIHKCLSIDWFSPIKQDLLIKSQSKRPSR